MTQLQAVVELVDADRLHVRQDDAVGGWSTVEELVAHTERYGHDGGDRLVTAAVVTLARHVARRGGPVDERPFLATWSTNIPRSLGLAGSSAVVVATMRALSERWDLQLAPPELAALALAAESEELGIAAGWMDRAVQAHAAPTLVDTRAVDADGMPRMRTVVPPMPIELVVAWSSAGASPSGRLHGDLRERSHDGDPVVRDAVRGLVDAALDAAAALSEGEHGRLAEAVGRSCALRRDLGALDGATAAMVDAAAALGASATSAGSGGAILAVPETDRAGAAQELVDGLTRGDLAAQVVVVGAPT